MACIYILKDSNKTFLFYVIVAIVEFFLVYLKILKIGIMKVLRWCWNGVCIAGIIKQHRGYHTPNP